MFDKNGHPVVVVDGNCLAIRVEGCCGIIYYTVLILPNKDSPENDGLSWLCGSQKPRWKLRGGLYSLTQHKHTRNLAVGLAALASMKIEDGFARADGFQIFVMHPQIS